MSMFGELRKKRAAERLAVSSKRTPEEQLKRLDEKFGVGKGAHKEREKLARRIEKAKSGKADLDALLDRFSKKHWVKDVVHGVGYRDEEKAIVVYASDEKAAKLPKEFEGVKVLFEQGEAAVLDTKGKAE